MDLTESTTPLANQRLVAVGPGQSSIVNDHGRSIVRSLHVGHAGTALLAATATPILLPKQVVAYHHGGEEHHHRDVVDDDQQGREYAERADAEQRTGRRDGESDRCGQRREHHGTGGFAVGIGQPMRQRLVAEVRRHLPGVVEDEHVVGADAQQDEDGEYVEYAEVPHVQDNTVDQVGAEETGDDAEHGPQRNPERTGLQHQETHDEDERAEYQGQVLEDV